MKIVSSYNKKFLQVIGEQEYDVNAKYRLANHTFLVDYNEKKLLYNNISKYLYLLDEKEFYALDNLDNFDIDVLKPLISDWSLVKTDFDEIVFAKQARWLYENFFKKKERPYFNIFTTTKCNARCYYCFENGQTKIDMSEETANDVADYIIKNSPKKEVYIKWFGGEPLYNDKVIDIICDRLREAGIKYDTNITTNGYLFDEKIIKRAKEKWTLHFAVITLDGTKEVYNKTKNYIYNDENAFERVVNNIAMLLKNGIRVAIRLNVGFKNFEDIKNLVKFIKEKFGNNSNLSIVPIALYDLDGKRSMEEHTMLNAMVDEIEGMISNGSYRRATTKRFADFGVHCMAESDSCKLITPTGQLGTCEHFSEGETMYGSIYSEEINIDVRDYFKHHKVLDVCHTCPVYVNCGGQSRCPTQTIMCDKIHRDTRMKLLQSAIINTFEMYLEKGEQAITD